MFKIKNTQDINKKELNEVITLSKKILRVIYILAVIVCIYIVTIVSKEWNIGPLAITILKIVFPLFIGIGIAWLFDPFVKWLNKKGMRRGVGTLVTYVIFIGVIAIVIGSIIPLLTDQINEFAKSLPSIIDTVKGWIDSLIKPFSSIEGFNAKEFKADIFAKIGEFGTHLTKELPTLSVTILKGFISGIGTILVGLVIGFYLLMSFDSANDTIITLIPNRFQKTMKNLIRESNQSLRKWVQGAVLDSMLIFIVTSLALWAIGVKAPLLFGLFCGITNVIPYAGPYIGGAPAVVVAFSQSPTAGILTLLAICVIQFIEGNFFQPFIMSKTTKLHPVTIILGLLIFGHFFGIIGMVISTPIIAVCKVFFTFFDEKYGILTIDENEEKEK
ncbi:MAG: AI-2E family transporter [Bacilli bacterium]|nr:AI-2E family transporter [Bacilli bacterium]